MAGRILEKESDLAALVRSAQRIAVLGIKDDRDPDAAAFTIPQTLIAMGKEVVGINPFVPEAFGKATLGSLAQLPPQVDVLDVFRRADALPGITDELLALPLAQRPRAVWLQSGIRHDASAQRLAAAGYDVVQDRCLGVYAHRYH